MRSRALAISGLLAFLLPFIASAHEHQTFKMGKDTYQFTVGSLNEPVTVDDKTGVELNVVKLGVPAPAGAAHDDGDGDADEVAGAPVLGLEKTLKVEISAGGKAKTFDLTALYGTPGSYKAVFFPTVQTTYSYRFMGTVEGTPVDITFTCNPAGHAVTPDDTASAPAFEGVTRVSKGGAFGCPMAKADLGFPEPAVTLVDLQSAAPKRDMVTLSLSVVGIVLACAALAKKRR